MEKRIIEVEERLPLLPTIPLSLQHLFAMFGSTVLVPFLLHVDPATCLFMNGVGTLLYLFICKWKRPPISVPVSLSSLRFSRLPPQRV